MSCEWFDLLNDNKILEIKAMMEQLEETSEANNGAGNDTFDDVGSDEDVTVDVCRSFLEEKVEEVNSLHQLLKGKMERKGLTPRKPLPLDSEQLCESTSDIESTQRVKTPNAVSAGKQDGEGMQDVTTRDMNMREKTSDDESEEVMDAQAKPEAGVQQPVEVAYIKQEAQDMAVWEEETEDEMTGIVESMDTDDEEETKGDGQKIDVDATQQNSVDPTEVTLQTEEREGQEETQAPPRPRRVVSAIEGETFPPHSTNPNATYTCMYTLPTPFFRLDGEAEGEGEESKVGDATPTHHTTIDQEGRQRVGTSTAPSSCRKSGHLPRLSCPNKPLPTPQQQHDASTSLSHGTSGKASRSVRLSAPPRIALSAPKKPLPVPSVLEAPKDDDGKSEKVEAKEISSDGNTASTPTKNATDEADRTPMTPIDNQAGVQCGTITQSDGKPSLQLDTEMEPTFRKAKKSRRLFPFRSGKENEWDASEQVKKKKKPTPVNPSSPPPSPKYASCMLCRRNVMVTSPKAVYAKDNRPGTRGRCGECDTTVFVFGVTKAHDVIEAARKRKEKKRVGRPSSLSVAGLQSVAKRHLRKLSGAHMR